MRIIKKSILKKGVKISTYSLVLVMLFVLSAINVFAEHEATVTISPNVANCNQLGNTFTVTVENENVSNDNIIEVRIHNSTFGVGDIVCGPAPTGWVVDDKLDTLGRCEYNELPGGNDDAIIPGESLDFTFTATMVALACFSEFKVSTLDNKEPEGEQEFNFPTVNIDCSAPVINKMVGDPKVPCSEVGDGSCDFYITQNTTIEIWADDSTELDKCNLGISYCEWRVTLDGVPGEVNNVTNGGSIHFNVTDDPSFGKDSNHLVEIECFDVAGNMEMLIETDKVDGTPPNTTKDFVGPQRIDGVVEWINGKTDIFLSAEDPDPTGFSCNIEGVETFWRNQIVPDRYCKYPKQNCLPCGISTKCEELPFNLYEGQPIQKNEESCHLFEFFSVDELGNEEDVQTNCFFVDLTPPEIDKKIGDPKVDKQNTEEVGNGQATWTTSQASTGTASAKLVIPDNPTGGDFAGVDSFFDVFVQLDSITSLSYDRKVTQFDKGWSPLIVLGIDADGDGIYEAQPLEWEASLAGTPNASLLGDDSFIQCEVPTKLVSLDGGFVTVDAYNTFKCYTPNVAGNAYESVYQSLSHFQNNDVGRVETTDNVTMVKVMLGGNPATQDNEVAYVDNVKLNGNVIIDEDPGFTSVTSETEIWLSCEDVGPFPSNNVTIHWKITVDEKGDGFEDDTPKEFSENADDVHFTFNESSIHKLEYWCTDAVDKESDHFFEIDKVDNERPVITKEMFGSYIDDNSCPPGFNKFGDCFVADDGTSGVRVWVEDPNPIHAVNEVVCEYQVILDGEHTIDQGVFENHINITFFNDSTHDLWLTCRDALGNAEIDHEVFLVDSLPPTTTKMYGEPFFSCTDWCYTVCYGSGSEEPGETCVESCVESMCGGSDYNSMNEDAYPHWINSSTPVQLWANDTKVGVDKIFWRNTIVPDVYCEVANSCQPCEATQEACDPFNEVDVDQEEPHTVFFKSEESCHLIEYFSVDLLGNTEDTKWQCAFVDNTPPIGNKEVGEPSLPGFDDIDFVVSQNTPIILSCVDPEPHPVNHTTVCYKVSNETNGFEDITSNYCEPNEDGYCCEEVSEESLEFHFQEDSIHNLEFFCEDALGNVNELDLEFFAVETVPPITTKTYIGPHFVTEVCEEEYQECFFQEYIDTTSKIDLTAVDPEPHPSGVNRTLVRVTKVDSRNNIYCEKPERYCQPCEGTSNECGDFEVYEGQFGIEEESCHIIEFKSVDNLENEEDVKFQCVFVDKKAPITEKEYDEELFFTNGTHDWITTRTQIDLWAEDQQPHPSGVNKTFWRTTLLEVEDEKCTITCEFDGKGDWEMSTEEHVNFTINEESCHLIEFYSVDNVNKTEEVNKQCVFVDNTAPVVNKTVGDPKVESTEKSEHIVPEPFDIKDQARFVTQDTEISLTCEDLGDHPVNEVKIFYKYYNDGQLVQELTQFEEPFTYEEDTFHELYYFCEDALGNKGPVHYQLDIVETIGPNLVKLVGDPQHVCEKGEECDLFITQDTNISLTCIDQGPHPVDDVSIFWRDYLDNETPPEFTEASSLVEIRKEEDSRHILEAFCKDALGNINESKIIEEVDIVDTQPPLSVKMIGSPKVKCNEDEFDLYGQPKDGCWFINQSTPINLSCKDTDPHPVGHVNLTYRDYLDNESVPEFTEVEGTEITIFKEEDSVHILEWKCEDILGNEEETHREIDIVDTQAPIIKKTILGPQFGVCPPQNEDDVCIIDGVTLIHVEAIDPDPHPVGRVTCDWDYNVTDGEKNGTGQFNVTVPFDINFPEESTHNLTITCRDALGNKVMDKEQFIVDKTLPETVKEYGEPFFSSNETVYLENEFYDWINANTEINLSAKDPEPHPSGIANVSWRITLLNVPDEECIASCNEFVGQGPFSNEEDELATFKIGEDSCHLIEFFSVDNVNKTEEIKRQCVFVDTQPPTPIKTVGEPKARILVEDYNWTFYSEVNGKCWDGQGDRPEDKIDCWSVTLLTPISLECKDPEPHPVNEERVCFKVDLDGKDVTESYCDFEDSEYNESGQGFCCAAQEIPTFHFNELSEHNLKYFCEDKLGNIGPIDEEKFKVEETAFSIWLNHKWNLISVPVRLIENSINEIFKDINEAVIIVWGYDAVTDEWSVYTPDGNDLNDDLTTLKPGRGYWILINDSVGDGVLLEIGGSLLSPAVIPPSISIEGDAWNLIGYYGADNQTVYHGPKGNGNESKCVLNSLGDSVFDKGFTAIFTYWEPDNPDVWKPLSRLDRMDPGAGYWLFATEDGAYAPSTTC